MRFIILLRYLIRRHRIVLGFLTFWMALSAALFSWLVSQTALREGVARMMHFLPAPIQEKFSADIGMLLDTTGAIVLAFGDPLLMFPLLAWCILVPLRHFAAEQERGLLDVILSHPVSRLEWTLAVLCIQVSGLLLLGAAVVTTYSIAAYNIDALSGVQLTVVIRIAVMQLLWSFAVGGFAALFAALWGRFRLALGVTIAVTMTQLLWVVLCRGIVAIKPYIVYALWHWAEPRMLFPLQGIAPFGAILLGGIAIAAWAGASLLFQRRDLVTK